MSAHSPVGGVEVGVDRAGLYVVDGDTTGADFAGQALGEDFDRTFGGGVGGKTCCHYTFADAGADVDYAAAFLNMFESSVSGDKDAAHD